MLNKVKEFVQRTMYLAENKVIPYAEFALIDSGEMVNIGILMMQTPQRSFESFWTFSQRTKKRCSMSILKFSESEISLKCFDMCQPTAILSIEF